jgi:hypothetical protein
VSYAKVKQEAFDVGNSSIYFSENGKLIKTKPSCGQAGRKGVQVNPL